MAARFLGELKERLRAHEEAASGRRAAPAAEPYCSRCLVSLSDIQRMEGFLLQTVASSKGDLKPICSICLAGL